MRSLALPRLLLPLILLAGCGNKDVYHYDTSLLHLASGYNAKMACSCVFVMHQDAESCRELVRVSPDVARFKVDLDDKSIKSRSLGGWKRTAHWVDPQQGCVLDP